MTHDEMIAGLEAHVEAARQRIAGACGVPLVLTIEGLGYRIVPAWVPEMLTKVLRGPTDKEAAQSESKAQ